MPFSDTGAVPDIVMNCHGYPTRMTLGQELELLHSTEGILRGECVDGTPFLVKPMESGAICNKKFTCGRTGERLEVPMYFGWVSMMVLRQQVDSKMHARSTGPTQPLTGQPVEGRAKEGGLRFGEMERDAVTASGAAAILQDRLCYSSDVTTMHVCPSCRQPTARTEQCHMCGSENVTELCVPQSLHLLWGGMRAAGVSMDVETSVRE